MSNNRVGNADLTLHSINSRNHKVIKRVRRLRRRTFRDREGMFLVEGVTLVQEAVSSGARLTELLYVNSRSEEAGLITSEVGRQLLCYEISQDLMEWVSDVVTSQGILGVLEQVDIEYEDVLSREISLLLIADQVRDPGNLGALVRIADAVGVDGFMLTAGCADLYNPKVVRAAAGSHFHMPLVRNVNMARLKNDLASRGMKLLGLDARGDMSYLDAGLDGRTALVVGNEAFGISEEDRELLDGSVHIPMPGKAESLNVATAAGIVLFEALRQICVRNRGEKE